MQRFHQLSNSSIRPRHRLIGKQNRERIITTRDLKLRLKEVLLKNRELRCLLQRLTADMIAHANFQRVVSRIQLTRINQSSERQPLTGVTIAAPVLSLLAEFLAVFYQSV